MDIGHKPEGLFFDQKPYLDRVKRCSLILPGRGRKQASTTCRKVKEGVEELKEGPRGGEGDSQITR